MSISKVLVVDDSPTERHFLGELLSKQGYQVVMAESGEEAMSKAKQLKPDLILMDVVMPGLNGFQATRAITKDAETRIFPSSCVPRKVRRPIRFGACAKAPAITW